MPTPKPSRWTKADLRAVRTALDGFLVLNTPATAGPAEREALRQRIPPEDVALRVAEYLDRVAARREEDAEQDGRAWRHFQEHPEVYGASTPAMVERFQEAERCGREAARRRRALAARLRAEGMPPGVTGSGGR